MLEVKRNVGLSEQAALPHLNPTECHSLRMRAPERMHCSCMTPETHQPQFAFRCQTESTARAAMTVVIALFSFYAFEKPIREFVARRVERKRQTNVAKDA